MSRAARGHVQVLGPLPPPVHGAAVVTVGMIEWLRRPGSGSASSMPPWTATASPRSADSARSPDTCWPGCGSTPSVALRCYDAPTSSTSVAPATADCIFQLICLAAARIVQVPVVFHHHSSAYLVRHSRPMALVCRVISDRGVHLVLSEQMREQLTASYEVTNAESLSNSLFVRSGTRSPPGDLGPGTARAHLEPVHRQGDARHRRHRGGPGGSRARL